MASVYKIKCYLLLVMLLTLSGCATYRVSSNVDGGVSDSNQVLLSDIKLYESSLPEGSFMTVGPIDVSIKKLTIFNADPTKEQANQALREKALLIGANAVINIKYSSGVGFTTWGYMDAEGLGVKIKNK